MKKYDGSALVWVISVIVGLLLWAMMLPDSPHEEPYTVEALNIISDMKSLKISVLAWYVDRLDRFDKEGTISGKTVEELADNPEESMEITAYLNKGSKPLTLRGKSAGAGEYILACGHSSLEWFVGYNFDGENKRVRQILSRRAKSVGLLSQPDSESQPYNPQSRRVWLHVITLGGE